MSSSYRTSLSNILFETLNSKKLLCCLIISFLVLLVSVFANIMTPFILKSAIDQLSNSNHEVISMLFIGYGLAWMISQLCGHLRMYFIYRIEQHISRLLAVKILSHLYNLSYNFFLNQKTGILTSIIKRSQTNAAIIILGFSIHVFPTLLEFVMAICLLLKFYNIEYGLLLFGFLFVFLSYSLILMKYSLQSRHQVNEIDNASHGIITDWLLNHESIRIFGAQDLAIKNCNFELFKREKAEVRFMGKFSLFRLGQSLILGASVIYITYRVGQDVMKGILTIGDFVLFNGYILQFILPVSILGQVTQDIKKAIIDMKGVLDILLLENEVKEPKNPKKLSSSTIDIEFKNVAFKQNEKCILQNASFKINSGETTLIIGPTGVGKSTIAKLILRLYDPTQGQILLNQKDLKSYSFRTLYENIGCVSQETYLLNDSIRNNLIFCCPQASENEITTALSQACLYEFINTLPQGLDTSVGDRGLKLSGGEKQRIALARLFLKRPKICIFDEASSSLDRDTELTLQKNIKSVFSGMTKIIITHRPFMIEGADKIISLSKDGVSSHHVISDYNSTFKKSWKFNSLGLLV